jgi:hypothetical protein
MGRKRLLKQDFEQHLQFLLLLLILLGKRPDQCSQLGIVLNHASNILEGKLFPDKQNLACFILSSLKQQYYSTQFHCRLKSSKGQMTG